MTRSWLRASALVLTAAFTLPACGRDGGGELPLAPQLDQVVGSDGDSYTLIEGRPAHGLPGVSVSALIGLAGGEVSLGGHTLTVPAGAVAVPTLFTMTRRDDGLVGVELHATVTGLLGRVLDVGADGFDRPVTLSLSYAAATNVQDPSDLRILYMPDDGAPPEPLASQVDLGSKLVTATLEHFSAYCMAE